MTFINGIHALAPDKEERKADFRERAKSFHELASPLPGVERGIKVIELVDDYHELMFWVCPRQSFDERNKPSQAGSKRVFGRDNSLTVNGVAKPGCYCVSDLSFVQRGQLTHSKDDASSVLTSGYLGC